MMLCCMCSILRGQDIDYDIAMAKIAADSGGEDDDTPPSPND